MARADPACRPREGLSWGCGSRQGRPASVPLGSLDSGWAAAAICHRDHCRAGGFSPRCRPSTGLVTQLALVWVRAVWLALGPTRASPSLPLLERRGGRSTGPLSLPPTGRFTFCPSWGFPKKYNQHNGNRKPWGWASPGGRRLYPARGLLSPLAPRAAH